MEITPVNLTYQVNIKPGERLALPPALLDQLGQGRWLITFRPLEADPVRDHGAFLAGYAPEDEGLYDDMQGVLDAGG